MRQSLHRSGINCRIFFVLIVALLSLLVISESLAHGAEGRHPVINRPSVGMTLGLPSTELRQHLLFADSHRFAQPHEFSQSLRSREDHQTHSIRSVTRYPRTAAARSKSVISAYSPTAYVVVRASDGKSDVAADGYKVKTDYTGTLDDGTVFDSSKDKEPLSFTLGAGQMIPGFDAAVKGMRVGETKQVRLEAKDAYGEREEKAVQEVPLDRLPEGVQAGTPLVAKGIRAVVIKVGDGSATVDFNHPLAGKPLTFSITLRSCEPGPKLIVEVVEPGDGKTFPKAGDLLKMHYTGTLASNGKKFDSSVDRGQPFEFPIGVGKVIKGWDQGVMKMSLGEKARLLIPAELGYGERGAGDAIPPNADLVFEVELLQIN